MRNLTEFEWECSCGNTNTGWWKDADFCECDYCGELYSWDDLRMFVEDCRPEDELDLDF